MLDVMYELPSRKDMKRCVITREMVEKRSTADLLLHPSSMPKPESGLAMPYVEVNQVSHYYEWVGTEERTPDSQKPVMVFIHGWAGSARYWESTARALSDHFGLLALRYAGFWAALPSPLISKKRRRNGAMS